VESFWVSKPAAASVGKKPCLALFVYNIVGFQRLGFWRRNDFLKNCLY